MQRKRRKKKRFGVFLFLLVVCIGKGIMFSQLISMGVELQMKQQANQ